MKSVDRASSVVRATAAGKVLNFLAALTLIITACFNITPAQAGPAQPETPDFNYKTFTIDRVDSPRLFQLMTDRSLRFDSLGHPIAAYGGDHLYYASYDGANWHTQIIDPEDGVGRYASLALDSYNRPRISYYDATLGRLKFAWYDGAAWHIQVLDSRVATSVDAPGVGLHTSIAIDTNNRVHISYYDAEGHHLKYATWDGLTWKIQVVDGGSHDVGLWTSIAVDNLNNPRISYFDEQYDDLKYAVSHQGAWVAETVDANGDVGSFTSLAYGPDGNDYISYYDKTNGQLKLAAGTGNGSWSVNVIDNVSNVGAYTSIAFNKDNEPCVSYTDVTNFRLKFLCGPGWDVQTVAMDGLTGFFTSVAKNPVDKKMYILYYNASDGGLKFATLTTTWVSAVVDTAHDLGQASSLTFSPAGVPWVAYYDGTKGEIRFGNFNGVSWELGIIPFVNAGPYVAAKVDATGNLHVAFYDAANGDLMYGTNTGGVGGSWTILRIDQTFDVGMYVSLALDTAGQAHLSYYDSTNGDLRYARQVGSLWYTKTLDTVYDVGGFTSIVMSPSGQPAISYYDYRDGALKYAYNTPADVWNIEFADKPEHGPDVGRYSSLAIGTDGIARISYYDATNKDLRYAERSGPAATPWVVQAVDIDPNDVGQYSSIGLDPANKPYISYYDATNRALKFAWLINLPSTWDKQVVDWKGDVGGFTSLAVSPTGEPWITYYDATNGDLKLARGGTVVKWQFLPIIMATR